MNPRPKLSRSCLAAFLFPALFLPALRAEDCGCPKPKVKFTEIEYGDPAVVKYYFNGGLVDPQNTERQLERDREYEIRVEAVDLESIHSCVPALIQFPHCTIEWSSVDLSGNTSWTKGTIAPMQMVIHNEYDPTPDWAEYRPEKRYVRITTPPSDNASEASPEAGSDANAEGSAAGYEYDTETSTSSVVPPGAGLEIPLGAAKTAQGFRSAGRLVSYGPVSSSLAASASLRYNGISEVSTLVTQYSVVDGGGVITEKHYIAPRAVLRVRGWNSATQVAGSWQGAGETLVEVYEPSNYSAGTHTFSGSAHSYYRLEIAAGNSLQPGLRIVQSHRGKVSTRSIQASGDGLTLRESKGTVTTETVMVPPSSGTDWGREVTKTEGSTTLSSVSETHKLVGANYVKDSETIDPDPTVTGDELTTYYSYYNDGSVRSVRKPDGSWLYYEYDGAVTITYSPWLSESSLAFVAGEWVLPTSGRVVKKFSEATDEGSSENVFVFDQATSSMVVKLSETMTTESTASGYKNSTVTRNVNWGTIFTEDYTLSYSADNTDKFLAGRTRMTWDKTGKATLYQYERGYFTAPDYFSQGPSGNDVRTTVFTGYIANPTSASTAADFTHVLSHSTKEVTITTPEGLVREETHVCDSFDSFHGVYNYSLAVAKTHERESGGLRRPTGTKINGLYVSKTEYVSDFITRNWDETGMMTEIEMNADGEVIRTTTSGNSAVPAVTTLVDHTGLTTTTTVNGQVVSVMARDLMGRTVSNQDATGAETTIVYTNGGRTVTRTGPGGVTRIVNNHFDGQPASLTGTGVVAEYYSHDIDDTTGTIATTTYKGSSGSPRATTVKKYGDGTTAFEIVPDPAGGINPITTTHTYYASSGWLRRITSSASNTAADVWSNPAGSSLAAMGHFSLVGTEPNSNTDGPVVLSLDRLTENNVSYLSSGGAWYRQTITKQFHTDNSTSAYTSTLLERLAPAAVSDPTYGDGLRWISNTSNGTTTVTSTRDIFFGSATVVTSTDDSATSVAPDSVNLTVHGKSVSSASFGSTAAATTTYDTVGRTLATTSVTGANTSYGYNTAGQLESVTDHDGKATTYTYYANTHQNAGLVWKVTNPASEVTESIYNSRGELIETTGSGTYRVIRGYNAYGEMDSMRTYRTAGSSGDLTQWTYSPSSGLLMEKSDAASKKTLYTYYSNGRLNTRTWARPGTVKTTYSYNEFGDLTLTDYSDTTRDVGVTTDRLGRPKTISDDSGVRTMTYHPVTGATDLISYDGSRLLPAHQFDNHYDSQLRPDGYYLAPMSSAIGGSATLEYDSAGRLSMVRAVAADHKYTYIPGTSTPSGLTSSAGSSDVLFRTMHYDRMQRLRGIVNATSSGVPLSSHGYTLDNAGRRKTATRENGQRWDYGYDTAGQVTSAIKRFPDEAAMPGHTFGYGYDGIGNRTSATQGGANTGVTYASNALNQYTSVDTQAGRFILGEAPVANAVTVNGQTAARAGGLGFYWHQLNASTGSGPVLSNDSVVSNAVTITGRTWTPAASVVPTYDEDGNLKSDGRWTYVWDAENRLIQMTASSAALTAATASGIPVQKLDFSYDSQGRRIAKTVSTSTNGTTWTFLSSQRFTYDGWNLIGEYSAPSATSTTLTQQATHVWGLDLSGTGQGAGGVGGLLATRLAGSPAEDCYPAYDGNGNITAWIGGSGAILARMEYSPFGQLISQHKFTPGGSTVLSRLPFGFSTKYLDQESGLLYYGYRYYDSVSGRWSSRDPIQEAGGENLYGFVFNSPLMALDILGQRPEFKNLAVEGRPPSLNGGEVGYSAAFKTKLSDGDCGEGKKIVEWDDPESHATVKGFLGVSPGDINHENKHIDDAKAAFEEMANVVDHYTNKCYCERKAKCYSNLSPELGYLSFLKQKVAADMLHVNGGSRGGNALAPYSQADLAADGTVARLNRNFKLLTNLIHKMNQQMQACNSIPNTVSGANP